MDRSAVTEDYYALLGVSQSASSEEIKESYKRLALRFHPDKNKAENATSDFQQLGRAWETLRDSAKRADYDRNYMRTRKSVSGEAADWASRRWGDVDHDVKRQWEKASQSPRNGPTSVEEAVHLEKARNWKAIAKKDYVSRLQSWTDYRKRQVISIQHYQVLVRRYEQQMEDQARQSEEEMIGKFTQAIKISESGGQQIQNHGDIIAALMEAKRVYTLNLRLACQASQGRLNHLIGELERGRRWYEDEESRIRQYRVQEALEILGPRQYNTPLFSVIDRRQQAINYWMSLGRVKKATILFPSLEGDEGPWHWEGAWERVAGENSCESCGRPAFHIILDCGPAKCPKCGMIVCNDCHRDLEILREYEAWLVSDPDLEGSLFSLEFEEGAGPIESWDGAGVGRCWVW